MKSVIFVSLISFFLMSCASQIMQNYVGKSVQEAMLDYGPPINAFDMPDGKRVFQWAQTSSYTTPVHANTTGSVYGSQNLAWVNSNTVITGGQTYSDTCIYSLFADWDKKQKTWVITGFKKPNFMCE